MPATEREASTTRRWLPDALPVNADGRLLAGSWLLLFVVLFMVVSHVVQLWWLILPSGQFKALHLGLGLIVLFMLQAQHARRKLWSVAGWLMALHGMHGTIVRIRRVVPLRPDLSWSAFGPPIRAFLSMAVLTGAGAGARLRAGFYPRHCHPTRRAVRGPPTLSPRARFAP